MHALGDSELVSLLQTRLAEGWVGGWLLILRLLLCSCCWFGVWLDCVVRKVRACVPGGLEDWPRDTPHPGPGRGTHLEDGRTVDSVDRACC